VRMARHCENGQAVAEFLKDKSLKLVVDPVMISTSGAKLLKDDAVQVLCRELFPRASLLTPNLDEAVYLLEHPIRNRSELSDAARELYQRFGFASRETSFPYLFS